MTRVECCFVFITIETKVIFWKGFHVTTNYFFKKKCFAYKTYTVLSIVLSEGKNNI